MTAATVIRCLDNLFALCGTVGFVLSSNRPVFVPGEFKKHALQKGIASSASTSTTYQPFRNDQAKKTVDTVWKAEQLALKTMGYLNRVGKLFGGYAAYCADIIMHCYKHYSS